MRRLQGEIQKIFKQRFPGSHDEFKHITCIFPMSNIKLRAVYTRLSRMQGLELSCFDYKNRVLLIVAAYFWSVQAPAGGIFPLVSRFLIYPGSMGQ